MSKYDDQYRSENSDSLSAFLDNEASEQDIEILLASDRQTLAQKVDSYHQIHQTIQSDSEPLVFDSGSFLDQFHRKLDAGIEDSNVVAFPKRHSSVQPVALAPNTDADVVATTVPKARKKKGLISGLAMAASVAFAVVLGGNVLLNDNTGTVTPNFASNAPSQDLSVMAASERESNLEDNERLQNYLRQHAQQASMTVGQGMIPMAKVVSYPQGNAP